MKKGLCLINRLVAAFGIGVLVAIVFPPQRVLFLTVVVLIALSIGCSSMIRG